MLRFVKLDLTRSYMWLGFFIRKWKWCFWVWSQNVFKTVFRSFISFVVLTILVVVTFKATCCWVECSYFSILRQKSPFKILYYTDAHFLWKFCSKVLCSTCLNVPCYFAYFKTLSIGSKQNVDRVFLGVKRAALWILKARISHLKLLKMDSYKTVLES